MVSAPGHGSTARGKGEPPLKGGRRIVIMFDEDTFAEVRARAVAQGHAFAAEVRELVEFGLEAVKP